MDWGPNCYAGVTYNNTPDGKRIFMAWMKPLSDSVHPGTAWTGSMTVPRELSLTERNGKIHLVQNPICPPTKKLTLSAGETVSGSIEIRFDGNLLHFEDYSMPVAAIDGKLEVAIWLDSCSIEIIADEGSKSLSATVFPKDGMPII
jgi:sucrose-6-phosphate hydrolase SacC (GH32 family)